MIQWMPFAKISDLLDKHSQKRGLGRQVQAAMALEFFTRITGTMFDHDAMKAMRPLYLKDNILVVAVLSPILAQELRLREQKIVSEINRKVGSNIVRSMRFLS